MITEVNLSWLLTNTEATGLKINAKRSGFVVFIIKYVKNSIKSAKACL